MDEFVYEQSYEDEQQKTWNADETEIKGEFVFETVDDNNVEAVYHRTVDEVREDRREEYDDADPSDAEAPKHIWTPLSIKMLIHEYRELANDFANPRKKKKDSFNKIAIALKNAGYDVTGEACHRKWRNLMKTYRYILNNIRRSDSARRTWEYLHEFNDLFGQSSALQLATRSRNPRDVQTGVTKHTQSSNQQKVSNVEGDHSAGVGPSTSRSCTPTLTSSSNSPTHNPADSAEPSGKVRIIYKRRSKHQQATNEPPQWLKTILDEKEKKDASRHKQVVELLKERNNIMKDIRDYLFKK